MLVFILAAPAVARDTGQTFTTGFLEAARPFPYFRLMGWLSTNHNAPFDAKGPIPLRWADRRLPNHATQEDDGKINGVAWEYVAELGNATGRDLWINIPVAADDDYVLELARLLHRSLDPGVGLYLEHSNEVWNWGFMQSSWNSAMAEQEVKAGRSSLNHDGDAGVDTLRRRRHARRSLEIVKIFGEVFGKKEINGRIKGILPWWTIRPGEYEDMLKFIEKHYGPPRKHFFAIASTGYFDYKDDEADAGDTVEDVLDKMAASLERTGAMWPPLNRVAAEWGLRHVVYEGGENTSPDFGAHTRALASRIRAARHARMGGLIDDLIRNKWFGRGGGEADVFTCFTLCGAYCRYGTWGLTDDINHVNRNHKYPAVVRLLGAAGGAKGGDPEKGPGGKSGSRIREKR